MRARFGFIIMIIVLSAIHVVAQNHYREIDFNQVKTEMLQDGLSRSVDIEEEYDCSIFYIGDICIVHLHQHCSGVTDAAIQRFYKYQNGQWVFIQELSLWNGYELEQIGENLFHAYMYKNAAVYEAHRYESVMYCDSFAMKPIIEHEGVDYTNYLYNKYINGDVEYFNKYIGDTICDDYEVFDIEVVNNVLKSYNLMHTIKILNGFDTDQEDLQTIDSVTVKNIICK